jgi:integrase
MKGLSQTVIGSVYNDLILIIRHAYLDGIISKDYTGALIRPKAKKDKPRRALTPDERRAVIAVAQTRRKFYAYLFMILCGCRPSEAFRIQKEDLDYEKKTVHIRGTKTAQSDRVVPCPDIILDLCRYILTGPITVSAMGMEVTKEMQVRIWHSFYAFCHHYLGGKIYRNAPKAPFPFGQDLTAYNLRHEYCTELARRGIDVRITQKLMGHASPEMTLRVYTNLSDEDLNTEEIRKVINGSYK